MADEVFERVSTQLVEQAKHVDLTQLAAGYVQLSKWSQGELAGPCPNPSCSAKIDGFHVRTDWFKCYQCHPKPGDAIEFVCWLDRVDFRQAVEILTSAALPYAERVMQPVVKPQGASKGDYDYRSPEWQEKAGRLVESAHRALLVDPIAEPGRQYLLGRSLTPEGWIAYQLGYNAALSIPGTGGQRKAPAISIPWIVGGTLRGIRYRFLEVQDSQKQSAYFGSRFTSALFGGQALGRGIKALSTLLIVEGELNAISCWQIAHKTALDVLSLGSEGTKLTNAMLDAIQQYRRVFVWADRKDVAKDLINEIAGAWGIQSPNGQDANDLLKLGLLGAFLGSVRLKAAANDDECQALLWDLWEGARYRAGGVDRGTAEVIQKIAGQLELQAPVIESEPDKWRAV